MKNQIIQNNSCDKRRTRKIYITIPRGGIRL